jgi:hypothetical protein
MFILSTYADGPYWTSSLEPLLYPTGCSFYRPFSYQEPYLTPILLDVFKDEKQLKSFLADKNRNNGVFGIRFRNVVEPEYRGKLVPLRRLKLTDVQIKDTVQVSFRLDDYVKLSAQERFEAIKLDGIVDYSKPENTLMFEIPSSKMQAFDYDLEAPNKLWLRLTDDQSISESVRNIFLGAMVLRLIRVTERGSGATLEPKLLESGSERPSFGFELRSGTVYDFDLAYNRLFGPGESEELIKHDFLLRSPGEHFAVSRDRLPITGNYRTETIWVQPQVGQPASVLLEWVGVTKGEKDALANPAVDKILPLRVPVISLAAFWSRRRVLDGVLTVLFLVAAVTSFYFAVDPSAISRVSPIQQAQYDTLGKALLAVGAASAGLFASFLKDFIKGAS